MILVLIAFLFLMALAVLAAVWDWISPEHRDARRRNTWR